MAHAEYRLFAENVTGRTWFFDWSRRTTAYLAPLIIVDGRLSHYFESIKVWAGRLAEEHGEPLHKVEAIVGRWLLDENFSTVILRWSSDSGVFQREFGVSAIGIGTDGRRQQYILVPELPNY